MSKVFQYGITYLSIFISLLLIAPSLAAEQLKSAPHKQPTSWNEVADFFYLKPGSPEMKMLKQGKTNWGWKNMGKNQPVVSHRKGTSGIPLPGKKTIKRALQPTKPELRALGEYHKQQNLKQIAKLRKSRNYVDPDTLTRCTESKTEIRKKVLPGFEEKENTAPGAATGPAIYDVLVLYPQDIPPDIDKAFGQTTRVLRYSQDSSKRSRTVSQLGITCIPSRVRVLGKGSFSYEGLDAVKNYDKDPHGILDEQMEHVKDYW